ncbi:putative hydrolase YxeP [Corynebacterium cystitidis DSM 20524]|uniref:Hippurate hydrolase n=2 Tax=Corynebacterium cystitidis TaxID=35757 RepID=A0A1H9R500_9CORY|nr:putative hydrolase YxeP [Corynebacterium cystitidis DSM 20524]SER67615.1 hippurate hydrolase [Corynebacterium cystitidis DSM 20524]SNV86282.1 peptidase [Corynebacterium cystitidis]
MSSVQTIIGHLDTTRDHREKLYKHFHQHPELSMQEHATADKIRAELDRLGIPHHTVGGTGVVATIANGEGPVVATRGDTDGLPMQEDSGKEYASTATQVDEATGKEVPTAHSCGHDIHIMSLLGALEALNATKDAWSGTFIAVFQPGEETASGARAMVDDGIAELIGTPDVYLGQHVLGTLPLGAVGTRVGPTLSSAFSVKVTIHGKGSHGSMPELSVDPVVTAASIVGKLQTIVSREVAAAETAVVTVGAIHAGSKSNIIPDSAELLINTRAYTDATGKHLREAIERLVQAECHGARCPQEPEFEYYDVYPLTDNDADTTARVREAFNKYFGDQAMDLAPVPASEDFSIIADAVGAPYTFWGLGGFEDYEYAPGNHNPAFAPDIQPTLDRGAEAIIVASSPWLIGDI